MNLGHICRPASDSLLIISPQFDSSVLTNRMSVVTFAVCSKNCKMPVNTIKRDVPLISLYCDNRWKFSDWSCCVCRSHYWLYCLLLLATLNSRLKVKVQDCFISLLRHISTNWPANTVFLFNSGQLWRRFLNYIQSCLTSHTVNLHGLLIFNLQVI